MAEEPDRLRQDIERTRASLTRDVDLLAEKTSPTKVARRRWTAVKEKVMGSPKHARHAASGTTSSAVDTVQDKTSSAVSTVQDRAHDATDAVRGAPQAVAVQTQGNPLAAGIIAFGVGMLAATLIAVFVIPVLFVLVERFSQRGKNAEHVPSTVGGTIAHSEGDD